jgi:hypothetical protein
MRDLVTKKTYQLYILTLEIQPEMALVLRTETCCWKI